MFKAYVLIKFESNADLSQVKHALEYPSVTSVDVVMGPYDSISVIEAEDWKTLSEIARRIRKCPGIVESITCPIVE